MGLVWIGLGASAAQPQTLTWTSPAPNLPLLWGRAYPLTAVSSSGLPVSFRLQEGPASLSDGRVTAMQAGGAIVLVAEQAGDALHAPVRLVRTWNRPSDGGVDPVGQWPGYPRGEANAVAVQGGLAYVASGSAGLAIYDLSDPAMPRRVGGIPTRDQAVAVQVDGRLAYVADREALQVFDVGDPAAPVWLGEHDPAGALRGVRVVGTTAFVTVPDALLVIDVGRPSEPVPIGRIGIQGSPQIHA